MSETEVFAVVILLAVCAGLLFLLLMAVVRAGGCLQRLEQLLEERSAPAAAAAPLPTAATKSANGGEFRTFLREDPARQKLSKSEQFSAYRRWRHEKGLNWSSP